MQYLMMQTMMVSYTATRYYSTFSFANVRVVNIIADKIYYSEYVHFGIDLDTHMLVDYSEDEMRPYAISEEFLKGSTYEFDNERDAVLFYCLHFNIAPPNEKGDSILWRI